MIWRPQLSGLVLTGILISNESLHKCEKATICYLWKRSNEYHYKLGKLVIQVLNA